MARKRILVPKQVWEFASDAPFGTVRNAGSDAVDTQSRHVTKKEMIRAWMPYAFIAGILLITRIPAFGLKAMLNSVSIHVSSILGNDALTYDLALLYSPGLIPFALVSVGMLIIKRDSLTGKDVADVFGRTGKQVLMIAIALVSGIGMVQIMLGSGVNHSSLESMLTLVSTGLTAATGRAFPLFSPILGVFGGLNFDQLKVSLGGEVTLMYGKFITAVINFLIMAFILFSIIKALNAASSKIKKPEEEEAPTTKMCPYCMCDDVAIGATKCPHCASVLPVEETAEQA